MTEQALTGEQLHAALAAHGLDFFAGVPDSLLGDFCAYLLECVPTSRHVITANEGGAVAVAAGHYLATNEIGVVYMQNSGLGNAINPLTSLVAPEIYAIPTLLIVGWRGAMGLADEPQHAKMGTITPGVCDVLGLPYEILPRDPLEADATIARAVASMRSRSAPFALLVPPSHLKRGHSARAPNRYPMSREEAIGTVLAGLDHDSFVISTTGMISRELFEQRLRRGEADVGDFLTVGSMGHCSQIALGVALRRPEHTIVCLDGDGAAIMHLGGMTTIGARRPPNLRHIVLNNGAHDSVGGQPTVAFDIDLCAIAIACGYPTATRVDNPAELESVVRATRNKPELTFIEVRVACGARPDLGRPTRTPPETKRLFMSRLPP